MTNKTNLYPKRYKEKLKPIEIAQEIFGKHMTYCPIVGYKLYGFPKSPYEIIQLSQQTPKLKLVKTSQ